MYDGVLIQMLIFSNWGHDRAQSVERSLKMSRRTLFLPLFHSWIIKQPLLVQFRLWQSKYAHGRIQRGFSTTESQNAKRLTPNSR